ncbi:MAG: hypothetical protein UZ07_CHB004003386 [Chlorobi bacterium OLB7]|nr:MAG: hypothetical protein UZ07_CHB004003386 [Chlorobi bacterium OLB7]
MERVRRWRASQRRNQMFLQGVDILGTGADGGVGACGELRRKFGHLHPNGPGSRLPMRTDCGADGAVQRGVVQHHPKCLEDFGAVVDLLAGHCLNLGQRGIGSAHRRVESLHLNLNFKLLDSPLLRFRAPHRGQQVHRSHGNARGSGNPLQHNQCLAVGGIGAEGWLVDRLVGIGFHGGKSTVETGNRKAGGNGVERILEG